MAKRFLLTLLLLLCVKLVTCQNFMRQLLVKNHVKEIRAYDSCLFYSNKIDMMVFTINDSGFVVKKTGIKYKQDSTDVQPDTCEVTYSAFTNFNKLLARKHYQNGKLENEFTFTWLGQDTAITTYPYGDKTRKEIHLVKNKGKTELDKIYHNDTLIDISITKNGRTKNTIQFAKGKIIERLDKYGNIVKTGFRKHKGLHLFYKYSRFYVYQYNAAHLITSEKEYHIMENKKTLTHYWTYQYISK